MIQPNLLAYKAIKLLIFLGLFLSLSPIAKSQGGTTTVTATIRDPNGALYTNSQVNITFFDPGTPGKLPLLNGSTFQTTYTIFATDSFAKFSVQLPDNGIIDSSSGTVNTAWTFRVIYSDRATSFVYQTPINCAANIPATCTAGVMDISSQLQAVAALLPATAGGGGAFIVKTVPCASSSTFLIGGSAPTSANTAFNINLNCNVTSSTVSQAGGGPIQIGTIAQFTLTNTGGFTFAWPFNFIDQPPIQGGTNATTNASFWFDGIAWHAQTFPASGGGGSSPAGPQGTLQCTNGSTFSACGAVDNGTILTINRDLEALGPNPGVDIRAYGARAGNPSVTPYATGLTATCTVTQTTCTISSASTFINGDGIVVYGAGAPHSMTTPAGLTVTPSLAKVGTATGIVANGPTGATTYNYKIVARDKNGGLTAASSVATTTTGAASLGAQTVNITSVAASNDGFTITTSAAHGFLIGCNSNNPCGEVHIGNGNSLSDIRFAGWWTVTSVADTTHFTVSATYMDTRNGASTSATGGTATYYNANHLSWSAVTGAWEFYIYSDRANPGTYALIGTSRPQGVTNTDLTFDDFGSPMMDNQVYPPYVPTTPPVAATSDNLSTTIASGAGTTTLTLANTIGTTVASATARLDACPAILAAATAAGAYNGGIFIPADGSSNSFVVNSYCLVNKNVAVAQSGKLFLNETLEYSPPATGSKWSGNSTNMQFGAATTSQWQPNTTIGVNTANPGIYVDSHGASYFSGVAFSPVANNGQLQLFTEGGFNWTFEKMNFSTTQNGNQDYIGIGLYQRGKAGVGSDTNIILDQVGFAGGNSTENTSHSPLWYCNDCGNATVRSAFYVHRGAIYVIDPSGGRLDVQHSYINGGSTPLYTVSAGTNLNGQVNLGTITMDTIAHPCVATFGATLLSLTGGCSPSSGVSAYTGIRAPIFNGSAQKGSRASFSFTPNGTGAQDGIFGTGQLWVNSQFNTPLSTEVSYPIYVNGVIPGTPTCVVSAGGSLAVGSYTFVIVPVWWNLGEGVGSPTSLTCTTTSGNQTITVSWATVPGFPLGYDVYTNGVGSSGGGSVMTSTHPMVPASVTSVVISSPLTAFLGPGPAGVAGGPTMLMPGIQGLAAPAHVLTGPNGFASTLTGTFTAPRAVTEPDATGTAMLYTGSFANNDCIKANVSGSIITFATTGAACGSGGGGGPSIQTNGTPNTLQTTLNFLTSTTNSMGITLTPANPSGGNERYEASGTVNPASGGTGDNSPTAHCSPITEGASPFSLVCSPTINGFYNLGFNVTASSAVDPIAVLPGVPVVKPATPYTMLYSDRFTYQFLTGGSTFTINLPQVIGNTASNFGFLSGNFNSGNLTETANAADDIDGGALGGSSTILPNWAAFNYSESGTAPGHWHTVKLPTFSAIVPCTNALQFSTSTGFGCSSSLGTVTSVNIAVPSFMGVTGCPITVTGTCTLAFNSFAAHQFLGNNTSSSAAPIPSLIGSSDVTTNIYAADTGAVNAYVIAPSPAITALTAGTIVSFTTANQNTGASTINVNSLGVKNLTKSGGTALVSGDIKANTPILIEYNTTLGTPGWELVSGAGASGSGTVTSVDGSSGAGVQTIQGGTVTALTTAGTVQASALVNSQTGTSYTLVTGDRGHVIVQSNAAAIADTLPQATAGAASNFGPGWFTEVFNTGATDVTITPTTSTINGRLSLRVPGGTWVKIISDGTNYDALVENGAPSKVNLTGVTAQAAVTTDQALQELSLPAGYLNVLSQPYWIHGSGIYTIAVAQTPTLQYKIKLCTVSGCGSGTVVNLANITTANTVTLANNNWNLSILVATNATGVTGNFLVHGNPGLTVDLTAATSGADTIYGDTNTAVSAAIDLTAALFIDFTVATSTGNTGNQITQQIGAVMPQSNPAGGTALAAPGSNGQVLVNNSGSIGAVGPGTTTTVLHGNASGLPAYSSVVGADMASNTVTATQLASQYSVGSCTEVWGGTGASFALTSGDDAISNNTCYNDSGVTRTITAVKCRSDIASNTTTVNPTFGSAGTGTTILSGALTCGSSLAYSSSGTVSNASWTTGTGINPVMAGTLTGTSIAVIVEYTF